MSTTRKRLLVYLVMILSLITSVKLIKDIIRLKAADRRLAEAEEELQLAKKEREELGLKLEKIEEKNWWEKQVRNVLKMARPDEVIVVVPEEVRQAEKATHFASTSEAEDASNLQKWWQVFNQ